jgi:hypothetical protein
MNTLLVVILLLFFLGGGAYFLALATRLVKSVERIANRLDGQ